MKQTAFVLVLALLALLLPGAAVYEARAAGDGDYTAEVRYDDRIRITYNAMHADGTWTSGPGDIQLGVLKSNDGKTVVKQLYCAAATVPFHTSPATQTVNYVDTASGYEIAAFEPDDPLAAAFAQSYKQVMWLVGNGYFGDLTAENASVQALNGRYSVAVGSAISPVIALVATKIAIWHYTDPTVSILSTSLGRADQITMYRLVKALIADADAYAAAPDPPPLGTSMHLTIDDGAAQFTTVGAQPNRYYYGPLTVKSTDAAIQGALEKAFLSLSGRNTGDIRFVADTAGTPVPAGSDFGQPTGNPYLPKIPYVTGAEHFTFYLDIPEIDSYADLSGVTINAEARAKDAIYTQATPALVVYGAPNGAQDWTYVQAFVGLMEQGMRGDLYGKASLRLQGGLTPNAGEIVISKRLLDIDGNAVTPTPGAVYRVQLTPTPGAVVNPVPQGTPTYIFTLNQANNWTVVETVLDAAYEVSEVNIPAGYDLIDIAPRNIEITSNGAAGTATHAAITVTNQQQGGFVRVTKEIVNSSGQAIRGIDGAGTAIAPAPGGGDGDYDVFLVKLTDAAQGAGGAVGLAGASGYEAMIRLPVGTYQIGESSDDRYERMIAPSDTTVTVTAANHAGNPARAHVINREREGFVRIQKVVKLNDEVVTPQSDEVFVVTLSGSEQNAHRMFSFALNESGNWSKTLAGVPAGSYKVEETVGAEGCDVTYSVSALDLADSGSAQITVTNSSYEHPHMPDKPGQPDDKDRAPTTGDTAALSLWWILAVVALAGAVFSGCALHAVCGKGRGDSDE
ncbi:MAG: Cys-Gln thioester bond-forming surface protein [Clostridiales Family XIII bacterium]|jgi:hypothetical protein|nr:Cys-Gln thioester bond-forming surface protein [Clostridiales Family XIII bacterium]